MGDTCAGTRIDLLCTVTKTDTAWWQAYSDPGGPAQPAREDPDLYLHLGISADRPSRRPKKRPPPGEGANRVSAKGRALYRHAAGDPGLPRA